MSTPVSRSSNVNAAPAPADAPVVGAGATEYCYSDVHSYTVVAVSKSGKRCTVQRDKSRLLNGPISGEPDALVFEPGGYVGHTSGRQRWEIERDPEGKVVEISLRKNGRWMEVGLSSGNHFVIGKRIEHYDFNF